MTIPCFQVDAFTDRPFAGNPAAVCLLDRPANAEWMQNVAAEMNLAETAFLVPIAGEPITGDSTDDSVDYQLRWFTPLAEVDLCGHATLAAAHVLWTENVFADNPIRFDTRSGQLLATRRDNGWIELNFPATPPQQTPPPEGLLAALGLPADAITFSGKTSFDYLLAVDTVQRVADLAPDFGRLRACQTRGTIVTAPTDRDNMPPDLDSADFVSRFFAPAVGIDEDPVTGSTHCALGPFWRERLGGNGELAGRQISRRGGTVRIELREDRAILRGQAVTVFQGMLTELATG